jgi:hypothetical protein
MIEAVFVIVMLSVLAGLGLIGFVIWTFRDAIFYCFEVVAYILVAAVKTVIQAAVALVQWVDEQFDDLQIADEPLARGLIVGSVGLLVGVTLVALLAMVRNQPWVIVTLAASVAVGVAVGFLADPDRDWSIGPFPSFPRRGGGPKLPLNL